MFLFMVNILRIRLQLYQEYDICCCLPTDRTRHKVNDPKADYSVNLGEGKVGHELRLEPCWSVLLIDPPSAMWACVTLPPRPPRYINFFTFQYLYGHND